MKIMTFENIIEQVVNNRTYSRKEKYAAIQLFLKGHSGKGKNALPEEIEILETLKTIKKNYIMKDKMENGK